MKTRTVLIIVSAMLAALMTLPASAVAAPCATNPTSLPTFLGPTPGPPGGGGGCEFTVGSLTFDGNNSLVFNGSGQFSPASANNITVLAGTFFGLPGLQINGALSVGPAAPSSLDVAFSYLVISSGAPITDVHLLFDGAVSGSGTTSVTETIINANNGHVIGQAHVTNPPPNFSHDIILSEQTNSIIILKDIKLSNGPEATGTANISIVDQLITQNVPEPSTLLLLGGGLVAAALGRKRFFKRP